MNQRPISIVYFTNSTARGGAEEHILTLLRGLDRRQFRMILVCPPVLAELMREDVPRDVRIVPLCLHKVTQVAEAFRLARLLVREEIDILHSHVFYSSLFASPIGRLARVPVIIETPHLREQWRKGWLKSRFFVDRAVGKCIDYYIAVSRANAQHLIERKGLPGQKILVVHNGTDTKRFDPQHQPSVGIRESVGFGANDPVFVVAGRLEPQKGHSVLLDAWTSVVKEFPTARLVCLGDGRLLGELQSRAHASGIQASVRFLGRRHDVADWFALAHATILPSFWEGLPLVAIESLAAGRAVIATSVDGTPEVVIHGETGLLVPAGDKAALAQSIRTLLVNSELRERLGRQGRKWVVAHFDERQQIRQTEELYLKAWERAIGRSGLRGIAPQLDTAESSERQVMAER